MEDSCSSSSTQELLYSLYCFLFVIKSLILSRIYLGYFESQFFNMLNTLLDMNWWLEWPIISSIGSVEKEVLIF